MKDKLVLQGKLEIKNAHIVIDGIDLANVLEHESSVFMVVEPLPESKPEKNCGNCGVMREDCTTHEHRACEKWQPAPAEPQGWEQRYRDEWCCGFYKSDCCDPMCQHLKIIAFIRAEIERVHAGYAPLICAIEMAFKEADFLPDGRLTRKALAVFEPIRKAEQNRRGEGGAGLQP